jgi:hypothetical protein
VTTRELPVATELSGVNMRLKPGGVREPHWHTTSASPRRRWSRSSPARCGDDATIAGLPREKPILLDGSPA